MIMNVTTQAHDWLHLTEITDQLHKRKHISMSTLTARAQDRMCNQIERNIVQRAVACFYLLSAKTNVRMEKVPLRSF